MAAALTIRLPALRFVPLPHNALVLQVDVPALGVAGAVLEREGEDGTALLDGVFAPSGVLLQRLVDRVEGCAGGEGVCGGKTWESAGLLQGTMREGGWVVLGAGNRYRS